MTMDPFQRVNVWYGPQGSTYVDWELAPHFIDPGSYTYQLQQGYAGISADTDWINVGLPVIDTYYLSDTSPRLFGKTLEVYYRLLLTTSKGNYVSAPRGGLSAQDFRDWRISRKILRQEAKRYRYTSVEGHLVKQKRYGAPCPTCLDPQTGEPTRSNCPSCYGSSRDGGYFPGYYCTIDLGLDGGEELVDAQRGTAKESNTTARFSGLPHVNSQDFFVELRSGRRWLIHAVKEEAAIRGRILIQTGEVRMLPFTDFLYTFPVIRNVRTETPGPGNAIAGPGAVPPGLPAGA
jgi:hypothetical protein